MSGGLKTQGSFSGRQFFVPYNAKIGDITHADTLKHTLTLANPAGTGAIAGETRKIIAIFITMGQIAGTGNFYVYPNEGANEWTGSTYQAQCCVCVIKDNSQRMQYALSVANDDWDLFCYGYVVES